MYIHFIINKLYKYGGITKAGSAQIFSRSAAEKVEGNGGSPAATNACMYCGFVVIHALACQQFYCDWSVKSHDTYLPHVVFF